MNKQRNRCNPEFRYQLSFLALRFSILAESSLPGFEAHWKHWNHWVTAEDVVICGAPGHDISIATLMVHALSINTAHHVYKCDTVFRSTCNMQISSFSPDCVSHYEDSVISIQSENATEWISAPRKGKEGILLKNGVFWDISQCGSCKNWHFGGT
jgi:hypothetical protein